MKKWYRSCGWMLVAALALELTGCAKTSALVGRMTGRRNDDQKLVEVDGKSKKSSTKKAEKSTDSQVAKKSTTKPKVTTEESSDQIADSRATKNRESSADKAAAETRDAAVARTTRPERDPSRDPFQSEEFDTLASTRKTARPETDGAPKSEVREVVHKVEDNFAGLEDLPEWAQDSPKETTRAAAVKTASARSNLIPDSAETRPAVEKTLKEPAPAGAAAAPATDLLSLCPEAQGELRDLVRGLKESDTEGLKRGIHRIGRVGPDAQAAAPALVHLLKHKDGFVRVHAALALARIQASPPEAVKTVVDGLKSTDPGLRSFAAAVLAEMGPQAADALATLAESLNDRDGYVRLHAAEVLIRYDRWSYQALDTLLAGLQDKDENLRWLATLAELAPESQETVDALLKATRDPVLKVKVGAVYALGEIGPFAKSASAELRALADSTTNQELQSATLYALQQIEQ